MAILEVECPEILLPLLEPARYKAAFGGRGGAKSHFFAEQIILRCFAKTTRVACIREVQATIKDSVKQLLRDKISKLGLDAEFEVLDQEIRCIRNESLIIFKGMQSYNAQNIKSLEGFDIAWVEEAQTLSETSLRMLRPTIRKETAELWFSWNPRHETDAVDKFFRGGNPPKNAIIIAVNWNDNPWFPKVLEEEKTEDYTNDPEVAEHVWGGGYERITEAAYFAKYVAKAEKDGRVGYFPYNPALPVLTSWDIGVDDYTAVWFWQEDGEHVTAIDYYETSGDGAEQIIKAALPELNPDLSEMVSALTEIGREVPFKYGKHYFPHDVMNREWGSGAKSRYETLKGLGVKPINVGARQGPEERVNAMRALFPSMRFHDTKNVKLGLMHLRRYSRKKNEQMGVYTGVLHDEHSHGCLVAGSMVHMGNGTHRAIELVKNGDEVWTPTGSSVVMHSGPVKTAYEIIAIETTKGDLTCTQEHKVLTRRGFIPASQLTMQDKILTGLELSSRLVAFLSRVTGIGFREIITGEMFGDRKARQTFIERYGNPLTVLSPKVFTSTTRMETHSTTAQRICNVLSPQNTSVCTRGSLLSKEGSSPLAVLQEQRQRSGTAPLMVLNGTENLGVEQQQRSLGLRRPARNVVASIARLILSAPSTASASVKTMRVNDVKEGVLVYDLTVKSARSYQANGLYLSNSDAAGEFAVNCAIRPPKPPPEPKKDESIYVAKPGGVIQSNLSVREAVEAMMKKRRNRR